MSVDQFSKGMLFSTLVTLSKAITHIQILLSISRSPKIVTVFFLATVCLKSDVFFFRYEVKFQQALECGGAYVKLLSKHDALDLVIIFRILYAVS